ncbi:DNA breaking-rejoining enzymes super family [Candidatus Termititenax aidoneus]|uniref:DNA breaking-rejoining enzymes super family n=1 Tax=Termititenax aidoneus TaxID=2218524 RepID=A0A388TC50_TERA1|nr:DNA breaking-rejoining enzymes super family [Candidatus Termititenax aidoneus]
MFFKKTIKDYADGLFIIGGYWHEKRKQKGRNFIGKSVHDKNALVKNYIIPLLGNYPPAELTHKIVNNTLFDLDLAPATKNKILSCLSDIYTHLIEEEIVKENPLQGILRFCGQKNKRGILSPDEMNKLFPQDRAELLKIWCSQVYLTAFLVLKDTGLRPGELRALQWKDWNRELKFFPITKAIEAGKRIKIKGTKTGRVKPALVTAFTAEQIEILKSERLFILPDDFIFLSHYGKPISDSVLSQRFHEGVKRAGIDRPEITPYWLRHTFNTRMLETLPDDIVRKLMGHASAKMTQYYRHADVFSLQREAVKISEKIAKLSAA